MLQDVYNGIAGSDILKRTQKGCEDELTVGGPAAMNGCSSEILYLLDPAHGLCMPEGNTLHRVLASCAGRPGVDGPFAQHTVCL